MQRSSVPFKILDQVKIRKYIDLVTLTSDALDASTDLRTQYEALNVFDGVHLNIAAVLDEPIVSTDTLFPEMTPDASISIRANSKRCWIRICQNQSNT